MEEGIRARVLDRLGDISREGWDRLWQGGPPFMRWDWLAGLEESKCVSERTGWVSRPIVLEKNHDVVAACPMYLKGHSMGEFVFDHEWAHFASRLGISYYPKILVAVPFTPVAGERFLTKPGENRRALVQQLGHALIQICRQNSLSSVHINFCSQEEVEALRPLGFIPKIGIQFHWRNRGFESFDDYLTSFRSDRRNKIKKERRELEKQGIAIRVLEGADITANLMRTMFRLYKTHIDQLYYGHQYLNQKFFDILGQKFFEHLCLILAERNGEIIAGTLNAQDGTGLYGRYWGAIQEHRFLHFNVCYYAAIEHCIRRGYQRFEAGAGGKFKRLRGLEPEKTYSLHYVLDERFRRALAQYLSEERQHTQTMREELLERSPLKGEK